MNFQPHTITPPGAMISGMGWKKCFRPSRAERRTHLLAHGLLTCAPNDRRSPKKVWETFGRSSARLETYAEQENRNIRMKTKMLLLVVSLSLVLLNSCVKVAGISTIQNTNKEWLQHLACELPCWQNITPQETKFADIVPILSGAGVTVSNEEEDHISFSFEKTIPGSVYKASDGSVDFIVLFFDHETLGIGDLEQVIDTPEKISFIRTPGPSSCQVNLLYPDRGVILQVSLENSSRSKNSYWDCQVEIAPENGISNLILIGHDPNKNEHWKHVTSMLTVTEWKGYSEYP